MSEKRQVPTFQVRLVDQDTKLEGPLVDPLKREVATDLTSAHKILQAHGALLIYVKQWTYIPLHAILCVERGGRRFPLPWPLVDEPGASS